MAGAAGLAGCSSSTTALADATRQLLRPAAADTATLNPAFSYLRVTNDKSVALIVLGYVDAVPMAGTEVWYSGDKNTIRLWRGRIAGTGGLASDWRSVRFTDVPTWRQALAGGARYQRQRDVMPGYAIAVRDTVQVLPVAAPSGSRITGLSAQALSGLQWFEERTLPQGQAAGLPPARFAVDFSGPQERVVYSEQCLTDSLCLSFQAWPVPPSPPAAPTP